MDPHLKGGQISLAPLDVSSPASPAGTQSSSSRSPVQTQNSVAFVKGGKRKRLSKVRSRFFDVPSYQSSTRYGRSVSQTPVNGNYGEIPSVYRCEVGRLPRSVTSVWLIR